MPVYEYVCDRCQATTEAIRKMAEADRPVVCDQCGSTSTHRTHSVFMARGGDAQNDLPMPTGPCGRCGDPRGSCGM